MAVPSAFTALGGLATGLSKAYQAQEDRAYADKKRQQEFLGNLLTSAIASGRLENPQEAFAWWLDQVKGGGKGAGKGAGKGRGKGTAEGARGLPPGLATLVSATMQAGGGAPGTQGAPGAPGAGPTPVTPPVTEAPATGAPEERAPGLPVFKTQAQLDAEDAAREETMVTARLHAKERAAHDAVARGEYPDIEAARVAMGIRQPAPPGSVQADILDALSAAQTEAGRPLTPEERQQAVSEVRARRAAETRKPTEFTGPAGEAYQQALMELGLPREGLDTSQQERARTRAIAILRQTQKEKLSGQELTNELRRLNVLITKEKLEAAKGEAPVAGDPSLTGEPYLATVPEKDRATVRQIANYKLPLAISGFTLANPKSPMYRLIREVVQYDPTFDATQYGTRQRLRVAFTSGKEAQKVNALNTAVGHIHSLIAAADALGNGNWPAANTALNWMAHRLPVSPGLVSRQRTITGVRTRFNAVKGELSNIFKQSGATDQEIKSWASTLEGDPAVATPQEWKGFVAGALDLMGSRLEALRTQYEAGMGRPSDFTFIRGQARTILKGLGLDVDRLDPLAQTPEVSSEEIQQMLSQAEALERKKGGPR